MKLYLVEVLDREAVDFEEHYGFVVMAVSAHQARKTITRYLDRRYGENEKEKFADKERTKCTWIGDARETALGKEPRVILADNKGA